MGINTCTRRRYHVAHTECPAKISGFDLLSGAQELMEFFDSSFIDAPYVV